LFFFFTVVTPGTPLLRDRFVEGSILSICNASFVTNQSAYDTNQSGASLRSYHDSRAHSMHQKRNQREGSEKPLSRGLVTKAQTISHPCLFLFPIETPTDLLVLLLSCS
jgi:hypothetical protein